MSASIIAVTNQKGGVGKTTTAVNLATAMAACGLEVLLVDFDPQGNASTGLGIEEAQRQANSYRILTGEVEAGEAIFANPGAGFVYFASGDRFIGCRGRIKRSGWA